MNQADPVLLDEMAQAKALYDRRDPKTYAAYYEIYRKNPGYVFVYECLGHCLLNGIGIAKDKAKAREFFVYASQNGDPDAKKWVDYCDRADAPVPPQAAYSAHQAVPAANTQKPIGRSALAASGNIVAMIIGLILALLSLMTPFVDTIQAGGSSRNTTSFYRILDEMGDVADTFSSRMEVLKEMFEAGDEAAFVAGTYVLAMVLILVAFIMTVIAIISMATGKTKSFFNNISGIAGGMLIIDLIAASWLLIINNAVGSDVLHFNGTFFIMALISLATMVVSSVAKRIARV